MAVELEALRKTKVDLLEQDKKWWQDNAIRRRKSGDLRSASQRRADRVHVTAQTMAATLP